MSRSIRRVAVRGASLTLWILGPVLSGISCRGDEIAEPGGSAAGVESEPASNTTAATALVFHQVSGGGRHTCGVTNDNRVYCWGSNGQGQLGDGTTTGHLEPFPVAGTLRFRQVSAGEQHTCGVTMNYQAYCWGQSIAGELGDGSASLTIRPSPVPVAGGRQFRQIDAGHIHTCAVSYPDNRAYCWGENRYGQLGDGASTNHVRPVAVSGGREFLQVRAGGRHTCGVTTSGKAFCWGENRYGQLGDGTTVPYRPTPSAVAGGRRFRQVDVGVSHTCGVTSSDRAFCWGYGRNGQMGDGNLKRRPSPREVAGELGFERVSAGDHHTCGETTSNRAYCWGHNGSGELGDGTTTTTRPTPVAVAGGRSFSQVGAGGSHTCGRTPGAVAYCWGRGSSGQLGTGGVASSLTPVAVAGPM